MAISFGLAKKIIEHPSYNLGLALPFVAAFYILNDTKPIVMPLVGFELGEQLSMALKILGVAFYYVAFLFMFVLAGSFSKIKGDSKLHMFFPIFLLAVSVYAYFSLAENPKYSLLFGVLSLAYLLLAKFEDGALSLTLVGLTGALMSLFCFVTGVLWFFDHFVFMSAITSLFGFVAISSEAMKLGWPMFVTLGYVLFYAVFQTSELSARLGD
jgi:hypothetical protein